MIQIGLRIIIEVKGRQITPMLSLSEEADHQIRNPLYTTTFLQCCSLFAQERCVKSAIEDVYVKTLHFF